MRRHGAGGLSGGARLLVFAAILASSVALTIALAMPAGATLVHAREVFGSAAQPSFTTPEGMAIDPATGDLLVIDAGAKTVSRFKPDGTPDDFSALSSTNVIDGHAGEADATPQESILGNYWAAREVEVAVAPPGSPAGTAGDIYLTDSSHYLIDVFKSTGEYIGQITEYNGGALGETTGVAVGPSGEVFVGDYNHGVHEYVPSANPPVKADNTANFTSVTSSGTIAAGAGPSAGYLFVDKWNRSETRKVNLSTGAAEYTVASGSVNAVSVDPANGHVYAASGSAVKEVDASGSAATEIVSYAAESTVEGVAVDSTSGNVYIARSGSAHLEYFTGAPVVFPTVTTEAATASTNTETTLNGSVDPEGVEVTECKFEYLTEAEYNANPASERFNGAQTAPCSPSASAASPYTAKTTVSAAVSGLTAETTYRFRLVAKNVNNRTSYATDLTVTTISTAVTETASGVTNTEATLNGTVYPEASAAEECKFQYTTEATFNHIQTVSLVNSEWFRLEFEGELSGWLKWTYSAAQVQSRLEAMSSIGSGNVAVSGANGGPWTVEFKGALASAEVPLLVVQGEHTGAADGKVEGADWTGAQVAPCSPAPASGTGYSAKTPVSADLTGLAPETTYHFRLTVKNAAATLWTGAAEAFTTPGPPHVADVQITATGTTTVSLSALIDPNGGSTTFRVFYGTASAYEHSTTESEPVGSDRTWHAVSAELSGLEPGATYRFRFVAVDPYGSQGSPSPYGRVRTYALELPDESCPNNVRRQEQGEAAVLLPECRAYELVTPADKGSGEPIVTEYGETPEAEPIQGQEFKSLYGVSSAESGIDGNRVGWYSEPVPSAGAPGVDYLSTRGADGWTSQDVVPPMSSLNGLTCTSSQLGVPGAAWSADLSRVILDLPAGPPASDAADGRGFKEELECGQDEPRLVPGEPEHLRNLFVRDNASFAHDVESGTDPYQLVNVTPPGVAWPEPQRTYQVYAWASVLAASGDLSHVVFEEELPLTAEAEEVAARVKEACENGEPACWEGHDNLYEWANGRVSLVTILPDGTPVEGRLAAATRNWHGGEGPNMARYRNVVSADGGRAFFTANGNLYVRLNPMQPQSALIGSGECVEPQRACTLQLDTAEAGAPGPSGGGDFQWASADGTRAFFTDANRLTAGSNAATGKPDLYEWRSDGTAGCAEPAGCLADVTPGSAGERAAVLGMSGLSEDGSYAYFAAEGVLTSQPNSQGEAAAAGKPNLYLLHGGTTAFVATLDASTDGCDWLGGCEGESLFKGLAASRVSSDGAFLGFNSTRSLTGYDNADQANGRPDMEIFLYDAAKDRLSCASCVPSGARPVGGAAIRLPTKAAGNGWVNRYPQRNVSDWGQVFFETTDALSPRDTNGVRDVYEYAGGKVRLLSSGTSRLPSRFVDAAPDGENIFIATEQQLVGSDVDTAYDYYDVRVGGGFAESPPPSSCGSAEICHGEGTQAPGASAAGTPVFEGPGNPRAHGSCATLAHRAGKLRRRASRLRRRARRAADRGRLRQARLVRRRAARLARRARRLSHDARRCRHTNRRTAK